MKLRRSNEGYLRDGTEVPSFVCYWSEEINNRGVAFNAL